MNHCRDCNSDYATPGTCNCFAVGGKRYSAPIGVTYTQPWQPWVIRPWAIQPYPYPYGTTYTIANADLPITSNTLGGMMAPLSYTND